MTTFATEISTQHHGMGMARRAQQSVEYNAAYARQRQMHSLPPAYVRGGGQSFLDGMPLNDQYAYGHLLRQRGEPITIDTGFGKADPFLHPSGTNGNVGIGNNRDARAAMLRTLRERRDYRMAEDGLAKPGALYGE